MEKKNTSELNNSAVQYTGKGNYKKASDIFELLLKSEPDNISVLYNYGFNFLKWKKIDKALEVFNKIAAFSATYSVSQKDNHISDVASVIMDCGVACYDEGLYREAEKYYLAAEKTDPENSQLLNHLGVLYFVTERYIDAENSFKKAVKNNNENIDAWFNLADTYEVLGKEKECVSARNTFTALERKLQKNLHQ